MRSLRVVWMALSLLLLLAAVLLSTIVLSGNMHADERHQGPDDEGNDRDEETIVAVVGTRNITYEEWLKQLVDTKGKEVLESIVDQEATLQEARSLGIEVAPGEIEAELKRLQLGYDSEEQFYETMHEQLGMSKKALREDIFYKLLLEKIAIYNIHVSDEQIDTYLDEHPGAYGTGTQLRIFIIMVEGFSEAKRIAEQLTKGVDFEQLAHEHSIDGMSAESGGDLGFVPLDDPFVPDPILKRADELALEEISEPIAVDGFYTIVKVTSRIEPGLREIEAARELIRRELALNTAPSLVELMSGLRSKYGAEIYIP